MKLHNVRHKRSLSQTMWVFSCIPFIFVTIYMSSSSRIEKLPSSHFSESAEWKVLHEKKKKRQTFIFFIWSISQNEKKKKKKRKKKERQTFMAHYYSVSSGRICQNRIAGIGPFNLSRSHPFFLSWLCLGYLFPLNVS